ncbi:hypothetical protein BJ742DRAFT_768053 [Cladochytrium replicatum]|nr:hypothetical protein BJ742DRAFT_768053 [Cladochytrium replicatum]
MAFLEIQLHDGDDHVPSKADLQIATATATTEDGEMVDENNSSPHSSFVSDSDWEEVEHPSNRLNSSDVGEKPVPDEEDDTLMDECMKTSEPGNKEEKSELDLDLTNPSEEAYFPLLKTIPAPSDVARLETSTLIRGGPPVSLAPVSFVNAKQRDAFGTSLRSFAWLAILILGITSAYLMLEFQFWNSATEPVFSEAAAPATLSAPEASAMSTVSNIAIAHPASQPTIMRRARTDLAIAPRSPSTAIIVKDHCRQSVSSEAKNSTTAWQSRTIAEAAHSRVTALARLAHNLMTEWIQQIRRAVVDPTIHLARTATVEILRGLEPLPYATEHAAEKVREAVETVKVAMWRLYVESGAQEFGTRVVCGAKRVRKATVTKVGEAVDELRRIRVGIAARFANSWAK